MLSNAAILQTRPQGEKSAEANLERRGVKAIRPREIVVTRRHLKNGKSECVEREVALLPTYIIAEPQSGHQLDVALGDMAEREPRKDVQRVVGWAGPAALAHVMDRHLHRVDRAQTTLKPGALAKIAEGPFQGFQVRIQSVLPSKVRATINGMPVTIQIEHVEAV